MINSWNSICIERFFISCFAFIICLEIRRSDGKTLTQSSMIWIERIYSFRLVLVFFFTDSAFQFKSVLNSFWAMLLIIFVFWFEKWVNATRLKICTSPFFGCCYNVDEIGSKFVLETAGHRRDTIISKMNDITKETTLQ